MADECNKQGVIITPPTYPSGGGDCDCAYLEEAINQKQDKLTAGENITISGNTISATGGGASYTAGDNITIEDGVISATDTTYTAGDHITITDGEIATDGLATTEDLEAVEEKADTAQTDATTALAGIATLETTKQDALTAGDNITIENGVISATDTTYTKEDILEMLGYTDQTLSMTNENGQTVTMHVLGYMEEAGAVIESNEPIAYDGDDQYGQFGTYPVDEPDETTRVKLTVTNAVINGTDVGTLEIEGYYSPGGALFECLPIDEEFGCIFISFWGGNAGVYAPEGQIFAFIGQDGDGPQIESFTADSLKVEVV